jgi:hypothetical protein
MPRHMHGIKAGATERMSGSDLPRLARGEIDFALPGL